MPHLPPPQQQLQLQHSQLVIFKKCTLMKQHFDNNGPHSTYRETTNFPSLIHKKPCKEKVQYERKQDFPQIQTARLSVGCQPTVFFLSCRVQQPPKDSSPYFIWGSHFLWMLHTIALIISVPTVCNVGNGKTRTPKEVEKRRTHLSFIFFLRITSRKRQRDVIVTV